LIFENERERNREEEREWDYFGQGYTVGPDGFTFVLTAIQSKAGVLKEEGHEKMSYGGRVEKVVVPEVKLQAQADSKAEVWIEAINQAREYCDATIVYTNGSMSEDGVVEAGWYVERGKGVGKMTLGKLATVRDGEVCGVRGALEDVPSESNVLILSDSQAGIAVVRKAGRIGRARTADLRRVMMDIKERQTRLGLNAVSFGWVKAHNEVYGNEKADQLAKQRPYIRKNPKSRRGG